MIQVTRENSSAIVKFTNTVGIQEAIYLQEQLSGVIDDFEEITIDLKATKSLDISSLQLIWSAVLFAKKEGKRVKFSVQNAASFKELLKNSGFLHYFFPPAKGKKIGAGKV